MTTETKPIIDLSEWEECTQEEWDNTPSHDSAWWHAPGKPRYFRRKKPSVKSLEEKVREELGTRIVSYNEMVKLVDLLQFARIIEEHYKK